jgi:DNA repair protein RadD
MFELRPYQAPIADKVFRYMLANPGKHPLVALPTGAGKTVVLSDCIRKAITKWPNTHVLVISHVKEILEQDYRSISRHLSDLNIVVGLYSAGLGVRNVEQVTVAGIQSIYSKPELFRDYKFIIIDECHLIPPGDNSMYRKFFAGLEKPRYFGLTATPFRLGKGYIYGQEDTIFDDLVTDLTDYENFNKLIDDGYLCKLKTQLTENELDLDGIRTKGGDFDQQQMSEKFNVDKITEAAIKEVIRYGQMYKKWLIFAIDIDHAEAIAEMLIKLSIPTMVIHSKMEFDRDKIIQDYKAGKFRAIVNVNVLTTGFDDPEIDLIALLRPTKSPVIHVQTIGRGLRIAPKKSHCLILDFAGNTERLGPINDIHIATKRKGKGGEPVTKRCPNCDTIHHPKVKVCEFCGHEFKFKVKLSKQATTKDVIATAGSKWFLITSVSYDRYQKANSPDIFRVKYQTGLRYFYEYVCIEHEGYAGHKGKHWAHRRGVDANNVTDLINSVDNLLKPQRIKVDTSGKYPQIMDYDF